MSTHFSHKIATIKILHKTALGQMIGRLLRGKNTLKKHFFRVITQLYVSSVSSAFPSYLGRYRCERIYLYLLPPQLIGLISWDHKNSPESFPPVKLPLFGFLSCLTQWCGGETFKWTEWIHFIYICAQRPKKWQQYNRMQRARGNTSLPLYYFPYQSRRVLSQGNG